MPSAELPLSAIVQRLRASYGRPKPPATSDPFELILWENAAYLLSDERRLKVFELLRDRIGLRPQGILDAKPSVLFEIAKLGGMQPEVRVERWLRIATLARSEFGGDMSKALSLPLPIAKKAFQKFPAIGEPGAEKILLFSKSHAVLALDSNGLRVLVRLGYGHEQRNYAGTYSSVREAIASQIPNKCAPLIEAHQLLRRHGMERCKNSAPICRDCPLADSCRYYQTHSPGRNA